MRPIALNARFSTQLMTGVQRYAAEISRRLEGKLVPLRPPRPLAGMRGHLWEQTWLPLAVRGKLLWSPCTTGPLAISRQVCTVHDVIPLEHPEWFSPRFAAWYGWLLPRLAGRVRRIATVSEFTRGRLIERFHLSPERVTTVPNAADARFFPRAAAEIDPALEALKWPRHYFLSVGVEPRKNAGMLVEAWRRVHSRMPEEIHLVMAGAEAPLLIHGHGEDLVKLPPRAHLAGYIEDRYLPTAYSGAIALVFPSLYEGFGLPVLEAMACGAPVITSNVTALPEVAGDAGLLVDPRDPDAIGDAMLAVLDNEALRSGLRTRGLARARAFSWDASAAAMWKLLEQEALA